MKKNIYIIPVTCMLVLCMNVAGHETEEKMPDPGFRPESEHADAFLAAVTTATIRVYPTIVRTRKGTTFSAASQRQIVTFITSQNVARVSTAPKPIDPGKLEGTFQWEIFQNDMKTIEKAVKTSKSGSDYTLVMVFLVTPIPSGGIAVGGIHCYILDAQGENAFSFLLNSHHEQFVEAKLQSDDASEAGMARLAEKSTLVGLRALQGQIRSAKEESDVTNRLK